MVTRRWFMLGWTLMSQSSEPAELHMGKRFRLALLVCVALYLVACIGCAAWQRRLIYFPPLFTREQVEGFAKAAKLDRWTNPAGQAIGMRRLSPTQPSEGRVLLVYGNGSCATGCARYADVIQKAAALDVFILEYPGYADRAGKPSQNSLFRAADEGLRCSGPMDRCIWWANRWAREWRRIWLELILRRWRG